MNKALIEKAIQEGPQREGNTLYFNEHMALLFFRALDRMAWSVEIKVQCFDGQTFERMAMDWLLFVNFMRPCVLVVSFLFDQSGKGKDDAIMAAIHIHSDMQKGLEIMGRMHG